MSKKTIKMGGLQHIREMLSEWKYNHTSYYDLNLQDKQDIDIFSKVLEKMVKGL